MTNTKILYGQCQTHWHTGCANDATHHLYAPDGPVPGGYYCLCCVTRLSEEMSEPGWHAVPLMVYQ
jgi:hypothetical protein